MPAEHTPAASGLLIMRLRSYTIKDRIAEWFLGLCMTGLGLSLALQPRSFELNPFYAELARMAPQSTWMLAFTGMGAVRLSALIINGAWCKSPHLRGAASFLSMFVWFMLVLSTYQITLPNSGKALYPVFLLLEFYCLYFAACDAGFSDKTAKVERE